MAHVIDTKDGQQKSGDASPRRPWHRRRPSCPAEVSCSSPSPPALIPTSTYEAGRGKGDFAKRVDAIVVHGVVSVSSDLVDSLNGVRVTVGSRSRVHAMTGGQRLRKDMSCLRPIHFDQSVRLWLQVKFFSGLRISFSAAPHPRFLDVPPLPRGSQRVVCSCALRRR